MRKSQSAIEFVTLASFMFLVVLGFFSVTTSEIVKSKEAANMQTAADLADYVFNEVKTAKSVNDGYIRIFTIPQTVNGINFTINITDSREHVVNYLGNEHVAFLPSNVTGNLTKGSNKISKKNGAIYLNYN